jgi:dTDP-4-dehydrorhamnose reductase
MLRLAKSNSELSIVADQVGAPTSSKAIAFSIADMVLKLVDAEVDDKRWGTYHFSGLPHVSWADFAEEIFDQALKLGVVSSKPKVNRISTLEYPTPAVRPFNSRLDCSRCSASFGIKPDDWRKSLRELLLHLKDAR